MAEIATALCWNPLELFCFFDEEVITQEEEVSVSSSGSISVNSFQTPRLFYEIGKGYSMEITNKNCVKILTPNIIEISKSASLEELDKIALNQIKYEDKDGKVSYLDLRKNHTVCHNLTVGFSAKYGFGSILLFVNNTDVGVYINAYYNGTGGFVQRNKSFSEGYYLTPVFLMSNTTKQGRINSSWNENQTITYTENLRNGTWTQDNYTLDGDIKVGTRTKNISTTEEFNFTKDLLFYYDFDGDAEGSTTCTDISQNGFDGIISATSIGINLSGGWDGAGYQDDGVDRGDVGCDVTDDRFKTTTGSFMIYVRLKRTGIQSDETISVIGGNIIRLRMRNSDRLVLDVSGLSDSGIQVLSATSDVWHDIFAWYNGSFICLEVDGVTNCDASTGSITVATNLFTLGGTTINSVPFEGFIDDYVFWNGTKTPQFRAGIRDGTLLTNWTTQTTAQTDTGVSEELFNYSIGFGDITAVEDTTPPTYSTNSTNSTYVSSDIEHMLNWTDETGLSGYIFSFCNGTWDGSDCLNVWNITTATYLQNLLVGNQDNTPSGVFFKPDGTKMYMEGWGNKKVYEYDLSIAWNVTTAVNVQNLSIISQDKFSEDVSFKPDGTKMYIVGVENDKIYEYDLSIAWNVTTAVNVQNLSLEDGSPQGVFFKPDGTKMYIAGAGSENINEYDLSIAWNITTAVNVQNLSVADKDVFSSGVFFKPDGTKMYVSGFDNDKIYEYDLSIAWNVTTAVNVQNLSVGGQDATPDGLFFKSDGTKMYIAGNTNNAIYEYSLDAGGWQNDTWTEFPNGGTNDWSNVTKTIGSTVGDNYAWCIYANDTSNNWNSTSCDNPFTYTSTELPSPPPEDTCTYTSGDWNIDCSDNCVIESDTNLGGNDIHTYGTGTLTFRAMIYNFGIFANRCTYVCRNTPSCFG